jgi:microcystin-dependent protein
MAQPYVGEIRMFAGNFAPAGWAFCDGQLLSIASNETLFQLIGTTYGGDGVSTYALPDLRGRFPIHQGTGAGLSARTLGEAAGSQEVALIASQLPIHNHVALASASPGHIVEPRTAVPAAHRDYAAFDSAPGVAMAAAVAATGGGQPHANEPPYLCVNFIISLFGIFPTQT